MRNGVLMNSELWFKNDALRSGFVMRFKNGYKVVIEFLKSESTPESINPIAEDKDLIREISWQAILTYMEDMKSSEGDDVGVSFDVMVYNSKNKLIRLPGWSKHIDSRSGVSLEEVVDILYTVKNMIKGVK
jgi:hypothetical protein